MSVNTTIDRNHIRQMYDAYNRRDVDALTTFMSENVDWPKAEGRLYGRADVKAYWLKQWRRIHTYDHLTDVTDVAPDRAVAHISQVVRDLNGAIISTGMFEHAYRFKDGLVERMDLRKVSGTSAEDAPTADDFALVRRLYEGFNRRDIPAVVALLSNDVEWANGRDGGHVHGREGVRAYWTNQWAAIAPEVTPLQITQRDDRAIAVEVHQLVRDLQGQVLLDETVRHVFQVGQGLVSRFDIENAGGLSKIAHDEPVTLSRGMR